MNRCADHFLKRSGCLFNYGNIFVVADPIFYQLIYKLTRIISRHIKNEGIFSLSQLSPVYCLKNIILMQSQETNRLSMITCC